MDGYRCFLPCDESIYDVTYSMFKSPVNGIKSSNAMNDILYDDRFMQRFNGSDEKREVYGWNFRPEN